MSTTTEHQSYSDYAALAARLGLPVEGDIEVLAKEPVGGLMGWHELAVTVRQIGEGVGYNYPRLAEGLCQHLGFALAKLDAQAAALSTVTARAEALEAEVAGLREQVSLLAESDAMSARQEAGLRERLAANEARIAGVLDEWQDDALQRDSSPRMEANTRRWFVLKAAELGVKWPHNPTPEDAGGAPVAGGAGEGVGRV